MARGRHEESQGEGYPQGTPYSGEPYLTLDENGHVVEHGDPAAFNYPGQPMMPPYPSQAIAPHQQESELSIKISARGAGVSEIRSILGGVAGVQPYGPSALDAYAYQQPQALMPYTQPYYVPPEPPMTPMYYDTPPMQDIPPEYVLGLTPPPAPKPIETSTDEDDEDDDENENDFEMYDRRVKRRGSKRTVGAVAVITAALIAGPAIQASHTAEAAVEVCAEDGITSIFGDPMCFAEQYLSNYQPEKIMSNLFKFTPPEQENE